MTFALLRGGLETPLSAKLCPEIARPNRVTWQSQSGLLNRPKGVDPMANPTPPTLRPEANGYTVSCACKYIRWWPKRSDAEVGRKAHESKCKTARGEAA